MAIKYMRRRSTSLLGLCNQNYGEIPLDTKRLITFTQMGDEGAGETKEELASSHTPGENGNRAAVGEQFGSFSTS